MPLSWQTLRASFMNRIIHALVSRIVVIVHVGMGIEPFLPLNVVNILSLFFEAMALVYLTYCFC